MRSEFAAASSVASLRTSSGISPIEEILEEARAGRMFILIDDGEPENQGDLVIPAQMATPKAITFMATHGRGLICLALSKARVDQLGLPLMPVRNCARHETAFTVSIEAKEGVTTGISALDRARTVAAAIDTSKGSEHLVTPGHIFPVVARDSGVLVRTGKPEAAVDVSRLAGLNASGLICAIMNEDGTMARLPELQRFSRIHGLKIGTIKDLLAYRRRTEKLVERRISNHILSRFGGEFELKVYINSVDASETIALVKGDLGSGAGAVLVHMLAYLHSADVLGEASARQGQLERAMEVIGSVGRGVVVLLGGCEALTAHYGKARNDTPSGPGSMEDWWVGEQVLGDLGVQDVILLTESDLVSEKPVGSAVNIVGVQPLSLMGPGTRRPGMARGIDGLGEAQALLRGGCAQLSAAGC
jgi:3,4-dihydroxy 2-butanone 4-phosphate synthase/GTP cyclohydrolase II